MRTSFTPGQAWLDTDGKRIPSVADYVWLPFRFDGEHALLDRHDEWCVEDYA